RDSGGEVTNGGSIAKVFFTLLAAFAEYERSRISERIRDVQDDLRRRGRALTGRAPFGWKIGKGRMLEELPREQEAIRLIEREHRQGTPLRAIAAMVKEQTGAVLSHEAVRLVVQRAAKNHKVDK